MKIKTKSLSIKGYANDTARFESISLEETKYSIEIGPSTFSETYEQIIETTQILYEREIIETNNVIYSEKLSVDELKMKYKKFLKE